MSAILGDQTRLLARGGQHRREYPRPLDDHLRAVSALAGRHAESFGEAEWAAPAGLWHDLAKYRPACQR